MSDVTTEFDEFQAWKAAQAAQAAADAEANKPVMFYTWLANGNVVELDEAASSASHVDGVAIVNRYRIGA